MPIVYRIQLKKEKAKELARKKKFNSIDAPFGPFNHESYMNGADWTNFMDHFNDHASDIQVSHHWFNLRWSYTKDCRSACSDVQHLKQWFDQKCLAHLHAHGFEIVVYDAEEILEKCTTSNQVMFDSQFAKMVAAYSIEDIDNIHDHTNNVSVNENATLAAV